MQKIRHRITKTVTSTTRSAISDGTIVVVGKQLDTKTINTNTEESVHTLSKIFARKKIEERQLLAQYFAQNTMEEVHRLGAKAQEKLINTTVNIQMTHQKQIHGVMVAHAKSYYIVQLLRLQHYLLVMKLVPVRL